MATESGNGDPDPRQPGAGQVVLVPADPRLAPSEQVKNLFALSDPRLSELELEELLDELLVRVREALEVDTVAILLLDEESNELVARAAKGIEEEVERGVRVPLGRGFAGRIAAERVAVFIPDIGRADIANPILREKGIHSMLGVPLIVEGDMIGVLHVGSLRPRTFGQKELAVLELAAARAAPGIERARLSSAFEHEHRVALYLQRSLLPKRARGVVGATVATRYLAAREEVGGDWYDVIELPRGLLGIAIGDVVGHGIRAAALMGQLRTALRSYAMEGHGPARTLELVDRFTQSVGETAMATAAYALLDTESNVLRYATAGHMPPVVIGGEQPRLLEVTPAAPLGAFPYGSCPEHTMSLAPGETLLLYTDGLVERRGVALSAGIDELVTLVREASSAEEACQLAVDGLVPPEGPRDDVAIVALQNAPVPLELLLRLPADPKVLSLVRRVLRRWLRERGADDEAVTEVTLAVGEACANAIEHAYSPAEAEFQLEARTANGDALVAVRDSGRWRAPQRRDRGYGLTIIEAAVDAVDINPAESGTEIVMRRHLVSP
jgi:anti-sigma regulatory factor (Ser/Thr protein kinase)/putative methionine-R-sulfoxide reductase with GAF domain